MKFFLVQLIFFFPILLFGQESSKKIYVEYDVVKNQIQGVEFLLANSDNALYSTNAINFDNTDNSLKKNDDESYDIQQSKIRVNAMKYYGALNSNNLHFVSIYPNNKKIVVALDSVPRIDWVLVPDDTKEINGYKCYKAKSTFRGSNIEAYFTPEIPIGFGPFKFKGLPGLILELYNIDDGFKYYWSAKKIIYPYDSNVNLTFDAALYGVPIVSYRSIVEEFENKMKSLSEKMRGRAPRGGITRLVKSQRTSIEKKYEWEER